MKNKLGLILALLNTVVIAAVLGLFVFTKIIYKRPQITESAERQKLLAKKNKSEAPAKPVMVNLEPLMANLDPFTDTDGKQKVHYVSMALTVELRDEKEQPKFETARPVIMDKILQALGKKKFEDLNQVQGRYVFRSQILDAANEYLGAPMVSEIYFNDFLLQ